MTKKINETLIRDLEVSIRGLMNILALSVIARDKNDKYYLPEAYRNDARWWIEFSDDILDKLKK